MTLFDGRILTADEVNARRVCRCGDALGSHGVVGDHDATSASHETYHAVYPSEDCGEQCNYDPSLVCRLCNCVRFREAPRGT